VIRVKVPLSNQIVWTPVRLTMRRPVAPSLQPAVIQWLDEMLGENSFAREQWWTTCDTTSKWLNGTKTWTMLASYVEIADPKVALMFKITWGGV
jgi:hypothetical protein